MTNLRLCLPLSLSILLLGAALVLTSCKAEKAPGVPPSACLEKSSCDAIESLVSLTYPPEVNTTWSISGELVTYSSPRATDLNADCIDDIVIGHGQEGGPETGKGIGYITAHDGATGELLWTVGPDFDDSVSLFEIVGTPSLVDLTNDGTDDVVIGGRDATLVAINGATGSKIWQFYPNGGAAEDGWYNFYTPQPIQDLNNDGVPDLLTANGGDAEKDPFEDRLPGFLMIISGSDGTILSSAQTPDDMETYMSPIIYTPEVNGVTYVLFGTGGETLEGNLWRVPLENVIAGDISDAQKLTHPQSYKGVIAPPSLADVNLDGSDDIIVVTFDGQVEALDGISGNTIWAYQLSGVDEDEVESYTSPAIGYFDNDGAPDVFVTLSLGKWPLYEGGAVVALSGWSGDVIYKETLDSAVFPSPVAADLNGDNRDEAIIVIPNFMANQSILRIIDFANNDAYDYTWNLVGAGTPLIKDLDHDGVWDLVGCYSTMDPNAPEWTLFRKTLNAEALGTPAWGSYLGSTTDGSFRSQCLEP